MNKIIFLTLFLTACTTTTKKEQIPEPVVNMNNITSDQLNTIKAKNISLVSYFKNWNIGTVGFDPYVIGNYHIDLGCGYYFIKQHSFLDTKVAHSELYALKYYGGGSSTSFRNGDDFNYCTKLHRNVVLALVDDHQIYQRFFSVQFTPSSKKNLWTINLTPKEFSPITIKSNLSRDINSKIEIPGYNIDGDNMLIYSCSRYEIPIILNETKKIITINGKKLRSSENLEFCKKQ